MARLTPRSVAALVVLALTVTVSVSWLAFARDRGREERSRSVPEPRGGGRLLWNGDLSTGDLSQYPRVLVDPADTAAVVDDPVLGSRRKALKFTVHNTSADPADLRSAKHRAQAESPRVIRRGQEVYIGFSVLIPERFPSVHQAGAVDRHGTVTWQSALHSIYGAPHDGASTQQIGITRSEPDQAIRLLRNRTYDYDSPWQLQTQRGTSEDVTGRWIDFVIHTKMSGSSSVGFREQWVNTGSGFVKQTFANGTTRLMMRTVDGSNDGGPNYSKVQLYYNDNAWPEATVYFADHRIGTTFDVVAPRSYR